MQSHPKIQFFLEAMVYRLIGDFWLDEDGQRHGCLLED
jgi:hypothetical protein